MKILDNDVVREDWQRRTRRLVEGLAIHRLLRTDPAVLAPLLESRLKRLMEVHGVTVVDPDKTLEQIRSYTVAGPLDRYEIAPSDRRRSSVDSLDHEEAKRLDEALTLLGNLSCVVFVEHLTELFRFYRPMGDQVDPTFDTVSGKKSGVERPGMKISLNLWSERSVTVTVEKSKTNLRADEDLDVKIPLEVTINAESLPDAIDCVLNTMDKGGVLWSNSRDCRLEDCIMVSPFDSFVTIKIISDILFGDRYDVMELGSYGDDQHDFPLSLLSYVMPSVRGSASYHAYLDHEEECDRLRAAVATLLLDECVCGDVLAEDGSALSTASGDGDAWMLQPTKDREEDEQIMLDFVPAVLAVNIPMIDGASILDARAQEGLETADDVILRASGDPYYADGGLAARRHGMGALMTVVFGGHMADQLFDPSGGFMASVFRGLRMDRGELEVRLADTVAKTHVFDRILDEASYDCYPETRYGMFNYGADTLGDVKRLSSKLDDDTELPEGPDGLWTSGSSNKSIVIRRSPLIDVGKDSYRLEGDAIKTLEEELSGVGGEVDPGLRALEILHVVHRASLFDRAMLDERGWRGLRLLDVLLIGMLMHTFYSNIDGIRLEPDSEAVELLRPMTVDVIEAWTKDFPNMAEDGVRYSDGQQWMMDQAPRLRNADARNSDYMTQEDLSLLHRINRVTFRNLLTALESTGSGRSLMAVFQAWDESVLRLVEDMTVSKILSVSGVSDDMPEDFVSNECLMKWRSSAMDAVMEVLGEVQDRESPDALAR